MRLLPSNDLVQDSTSSLRRRRLRRRCWPSTRVCTRSCFAALIARFAVSVDEKGTFPAESVKALRESRLLGLTVPTANGGLGRGKAESAAVCAILGEACASTG